MNIQILGRIDDGKQTCGLTGRNTNEVWIVCVNGGEQLRIGSKRLVETLRVLTSVGPESAPANSDSHSNRT